MIVEENLKKLDKRALAQNLDSDENENAPDKFLETLNKKI